MARSRGSAGDRVLSEGVRFFRRPLPSANTVLLRGPRPILVDTGYGADADALEAWLRAGGVPPERIALIVNTHHHTDHSGGNHALQSRYGIPVAAHALEAAAVNRRDPNACDAIWLRQLIEAYEVQRPLEEGDELDTGTVRWRVLHTPGHARGQISLHAPALGILVAGDVAHADDVGWIDPWHVSPAAFEEAVASVERLRALGSAIAFSGHGPAMDDPDAAFTRARARLEQWRSAPLRYAWHACKRIFAHTLIIEDGLPEERIVPYLLACPWFRDYARLPFATAPEAFAGDLLAEMLRAGAARWRDGRLVAAAEYRTSPPDWPRGPTTPAAWAPAAAGRP